MLNTAYIFQNVVKWNETLTTLPSKPNHFILI